jgi:hypothetical protein
MKRAFLFGLGSFLIVGRDCRVVRFVALGRHGERHRGWHPYPVQTGGAVQRLSLVSTRAA